MSYINKPKVSHPSLPTNELGMTRRQSFLIKDGRVVWRDLKASTSNQARDVLRVIDEVK